MMKKFLFILYLPVLASAYTETDLETVMDLKERQINAIRKEEIQSLELIANRRTELNKQPEILMRLIELYAISQQFYKIKENDYAQKNNKTYNYAVSNTYLHKGIKAGLQLLKSNKPFKRLDKVYYYLALNTETAKEVDQAKKYYAALVKQFPNSEFAIEGHIALGGYAYEQKNYAEAKRQYLEAAKFKQSQSYLKVLHKLGWVEFRLGDTKSAIRVMKRVVSIGSEGDEGKYVSYKENALQDLVIFYGETGQYEEAKAYFKRYGSKDQYVKLIELLAARLKKQGRYQEAVAVNREIIEQTDNNDQKLELLLNNLRLEKKQNHFKTVVQELNALLASFGPKSDWANGKIKTDYTGENKEVKLREIESETRSVATQFHNIAKKSSSKQLYVPAREVYGIYLNNYPNSKYEDEMRLYYADTLMETDKFDEAFEQLQRLYKNDKVEKKIREEALENYINVAAERMKKVHREKNQKIASAEKSYIDAVEDYKKYIPGSDTTPTVMFTVSQIYMDRGLLNQAFDNNEEIIQKYPKSSSTKPAVKMNLDIKNQQKDYAGIQALTKKYLDSGVVSNDNELQSEITGLSRDVSFLQAEQLAKDKKYSEAGRSFEGLTDKLKDPDKKYAALYNSYVNYSKAEQPENAQRVANILVTKYPDHKENKQIMLDIADDSVFGLDPKAAILNYTRIYKTEADPEKQKRLILILAELSHALGDKKGANFYYDTFINKYHNDPLVDKIYLDKIQMNEDSKRQLSDDLHAYEARKGLKFPSELYYRLSEIDGPHRVDYWNKSVNSFNSSSKSITEYFYAAKSKYSLVAIDFIRFSKIKFQPPAKQLMDAIKQKLALLDTLAKGYATTVTIGSPYWTVASLEASGNVFRTMADSYQRIPIPAEYKGDIRNQFKKSLDDKTLEFQKEAISLYAEGKEKAADLDVANKSVESIYQKLTTLNPRDNPPAISPVNQTKMRISYE